MPRLQSFTNHKYFYTTIVILTLLAYSFVVFAAAPTGGYTPGSGVNGTLDPACAPGDADCFVNTGWVLDPTLGYVYNTTDNVGIGDATPASALTVGDGDLFQVDSTGDIVKINNVTYAWPDSQASSTGTVLRNDASGNLTWASTMIGSTSGQSSGSPAGITTETWLGDGAGSQGASTANTVFIGRDAGIYASGTDGSVGVGYLAGRGATDSSSAVFIGSSAGYNTSSSANGIFIGGAAGSSAQNTSDSIFIGSSAGNNADNSSDSVFIGSSVGGANSANSIFIGIAGSSNSANSIFIGGSTEGTGSFSSGSSNSVFIGAGGTGSLSENSTYSNFIGYQNGAGSSSGFDGPSYSNIMGYNAGGTFERDSLSSYANFIGYQAGHWSSNAAYSNLMGYRAGYIGSSTVNANMAYSNFLGYEAGSSATALSNTSPSMTYSNFIGYQAGRGALNATHSIFIGYQAGNADTVNNSASGSSILIGDSTSTGGFQNSIAIGATGTNTAANQFLIDDSYTQFNMRGVNYTMPSSQGAASTVLTNNGSGTLTWSAPSAGITTLNALTGATQTFATGTSGTDFNISSATTTHTFNIPTASASNRGALSTTDWSTFNSKVGSVTTIGASPNANGSSVSSGVLTLQPASASFGGVVTTGTQTFAGAKTLTGAFTVGSTGTPFQVDTSGNLIKVNNIAYSWPGSQGAAGTVLNNDGSGILTWSSTGLVTSGTQTFAGNKTFSGDISGINGVTYTWPASQAAGSGYVLSNDGAGALSWAVSGASLFTVGGGTNSLMDSRATSSAGNNSFTVGISAVNSGSDHAIVIGNSSSNSAAGYDSVILGGYATNTGAGSILIGVNGTNSGSGGMVIGNGAGNVASSGIAIGNGASVGVADDDSIALGSGATTTAAAQFSLTGNITQLRFPLNAHSAGDVLTSAGSGIGTWQTLSGYYPLSVDYAGQADGPNGNSLGNWFGGNLDMNGYTLTNGPIDLGGNSLTNGSIDITGYAAIADSVQSNSTVSCALSADASSIIICTPSDQNLKQNIQDMSYGLDTVRNLRPVTYQFKDARYGSGPQIGFIAQELELLIPEVVTQGLDYKSVNYALITSVLAKAIQELDLKITDIENFATATNTTFLDNLVAWLGDVANGIAEIASDTVRARNQLCVDDVCVTRDQFLQIIKQSNVAPMPEPESEPEPESDPSPTFDPTPDSEPNIDQTPDPEVVPDSEPVTDPAPTPEPEPTPPPAE